MLVKGSTPQEYFKTSHLYWSLLFPTPIGSVEWGVGWGGWLSETQHIETVNHEELHTNKRAAWAFGELGLSISLPLASTNWWHYKPG